MYVCEDVGKKIFTVVTTTTTTTEYNRNHLI